MGTQEVQPPVPAFDHSAFLANLTQKPGVYRMLGEREAVLYVGKAKNLRNRVASYFRSSALDEKTLALVERIRDIQVTITHSEAAALLLEQEWIKALKPPFNIVFRDDKSYPSIALEESHPFPRMSFHRGARRQGVRYFGPYPSAYAVRETLGILQKVFRVRQCEDSFYANRSRPCLQYQINRCSGPCCGLVSEADYRLDVDQASHYLEGRSDQILRHYTRSMEEAAEALEFERAARFRDQLAQLRRIQERQELTGFDHDVDLMAAATDGRQIAVQVMFIRGGRLLGSANWFPQARLAATAAEILEAFLPQFYLGTREIPAEVIVNARLADTELLQLVLSERAGRKVRLADRVRGSRARWVRLATANAEQSLAGQLARRQNLLGQFESLQSALGLAECPRRIECFDISHTQGEATVASCVVFDREGPVKSDYRRFNIKDITPGDDYAAMAQAIERRYRRLIAGEGALPDLLLIDGGKGQVEAAQASLAEMQLSGLLLVGVAKGPERKAGLEVLHPSDRPEEVRLPEDLPALHLIQQVRDEAHRFAITAHRQRRGKARRSSSLEELEGIGPKRRRALLKHFGSLQRISSAPLEEIAKVEGINRKLAELIYNSLH